MRVRSGFGLIGYGAIGRTVVAALDTLGERERLKAVLVRPGRSAPVPVHDGPGLLAADPLVVMECAGHAAVGEYGADVLASGADLLVTSVGALAQADLLGMLLQAQAGGGRLLLPAGAVAGLDGLLAAALQGLQRVEYVSSKPPHAWRGTHAEQVIDLDHPEAECEFFAGSAREAALAYPKNANVAVAVALAGIGMDATRVRLVSSRNVGDPLGVIEASGSSGRFRFEILAHASPDNPKTSGLTAYSLLQCARLGIGLPVSLLPGVRGGARLPFTR